jgi:hypothetical protein
LHASRREIQGATATIRAGQTSLREKIMLIHERVFYVEKDDREPKPRTWGFDDSDGGEHGWKFPTWVAQQQEAARLMQEESTKTGLRILPYRMLFLPHYCYDVRYKWESWENPRHKHKGRITVEEVATQLVREIPGAELVLCYRERSELVRDLDLNYTHDREQPIMMYVWYYFSTQKGM